MDIFKDNKETFDEIIDFYRGMEEYGYMYEGYREEELQLNLKKIREAMKIINDILKDNHSI